MFGFFFFFNTLSHLILTINFWGISEARKLGPRDLSHIPQITHLANDRSQLSVQDPHACLSHKEGVPWEGGRLSGLPGLLRPQSQTFICSIYWSSHRMFNFLNKRFCFKKSKLEITAMYLLCGAALKIP